MKGFWDFSDPEIFPKNLMAIPSPQQNLADQAQFALSLKGIGNKKFLVLSSFSLLSQVYLNLITQNFTRRFGRSTVTNLASDGAADKCYVNFPWL